MTVSDADKTLDQLVGVLSSPGFVVEGQVPSTPSLQPLEFRAQQGVLLWRYVGQTQWQTAGDLTYQVVDPVEFRTVGTELQYKRASETTWTSAGQIAAGTASGPTTVSLIQLLQQQFPSAAEGDTISFVVEGGAWTAKINNALDIDMLFDADGGYYFTNTPVISDETGIDWPELTKTYDSEGSTIWGGY